MIRDLNKSLTPSKMTDHSHSLDKALAYAHLQQIDIPPGKLVPTERKLWLTSPFRNCEWQAVSLHRQSSLIKTTSSFTLNNVDKM